MEQDIPRPVSPTLFRPTSVPSVDDVPITSHIGQGDTVQPTRQERNKKQKPTDEELGCSLIDDPPKLPEFDETTSGITASIDENSTPFDVFF